MIVAWTVFVLCLAPSCALPSFGSKGASPIGQWGMNNHRRNLEEASSSLSHQKVLLSLRAGATVEEVEVDEDEDVDSDAEVWDDEDEAYDEETSSSDEEEYESAVEEEVDVSVEEYDTQLTPPPGLQMGGLLGVMLLARRIDLFNPKVVRFARYASVTCLSCSIVSLVLSPHHSLAALYSSFSLLHNKRFWYTFEFKQR